MANLSLKVILFLLLAFITIFGSQILSRAFLEVPALHQLEQQSISRDVQRVQNAFNTTLEFLEGFSCDLSIWSEAYAHMEKYDDNFIDVNFETESLGTFNVEAAFISDINNVVTFSSVMPTVDTSDWSISKVDDTSLYPSGLSGFLALPYESEEMIGGSGIVASSNIPLLVGRCPILPDSAEGDSRGTIVTMRSVSELYIEEVIHNTQLPFKLIPLSNLQPGNPFFKIAKRMASSFRHNSTYHEGTNVYWLLDDSTNDANFMIMLPVEHNFENTRPLYLSSYISMATTILMFVLLTLFFMRNLIRPIQNFTRHIKQIRKTGDYSLRVGSMRDDEIGQLSQEYDNLIAHIDRQEKALLMANKELKDLSSIDPLTNIYNRRYFDEYLNSAWQKSSRSASPIAICLCDVDFFKPYNDNYGHQSGDDVLQRVAAAFKNNIHSGTDCVARYGGEEFIILLTNTTLEGAMSVAENLCRAIEGLNVPHAYSECASVLTASIGVSAITEFDESVDIADAVKTLVERADQALYQAKETGRNRAVAADS